MSESTFHHLRASRRFWWMVMFTGALTLVCGTVGLWQYEHAHATREINPILCALNSIYHSIQMLILHTPHFEEGSNFWIEAGRWLGAFTLIATTWILLWKRLAHEFRLFRLSHWNGHHVVCGLGQKGLEIVRCLKGFDSKTKTFNRSVRVVVIDPNPEEGLAGKCEQMGVCLIVDDATKPEVLARARVAFAKEVIVITPDDETNVKIALEVREVCTTKQSGQVDCIVHLENIHLRERLQMLEGDTAGKSAGCVMSFFDVFDSEARRVLAAFPLDGEGLSQDDPRSVHVVILGFGRMGRSLALRAAKMGHFANRKPLRISVVDRNAARQQEHFLFRYPVLEKKPPVALAICDLSFHQADAQSLTARKLVEGWAAERDTLVHLFICVDDNATAVEVGLRFEEALLRHRPCNLLVRIKTRTSLAGIFSPKHEGKEQNHEARTRIQPFGMVEDNCCQQAFRHEQNEALARALHEDFVRRRLCDSSRTQESDPALKDWDDLREDFRESNRQQADHTAIKLRAIGCEMVEMSDPREAVTSFSPREIELLAEMEHVRWNAERLLAGWRYGTPSNKPARISENIRPWIELDDSIKEYDRQTVTLIPSILGSPTRPKKVVRKTPFC